MVYSNTFEGLRAALTRHGLDPGLIDREFRAVGIDFARVLPAYTKAHFIDALRLSARLAFAGVEPELAFRSVGDLVIEGYVNTVLGKAVHAAARLMGPLWTLKRMTRNLRTSDNCTEARVTEHGPTDLSIWINDHLGCHGYYEGVFEAVVRKAGAREGRCVLEATSGRREATYRVTWVA